MFLRKIPAIASRHFLEAFTVTNVHREPKDTPSTLAYLTAGVYHPDRSIRGEFDQRCNPPTDPPNSNVEITLANPRFIPWNDLILATLLLLCLSAPTHGAVFPPLSSVGSVADLPTPAVPEINGSPTPSRDTETTDSPEKKPVNSAQDSPQEDESVTDPVAKPAPAIALETLSGIEPASLPLGERLVFRATVEWKGAQVLVGHLELGSFHEDTETTILHARGKGDRFGYTIDQQITSRLNRNTGYPSEYTNIQRGSEHHTKKLEFEKGKILYTRREHCRDPECKDSNHDVAEVDWKGPIPWGTRTKHCSDRDCGTASHESWVTKKVHEVDKPYVDLLSSIYVARTAAFPEDGTPMIIPAVNDDHRWLVEVRQMQRRELTVIEGTYDAIELSLTPMASDGDEKKRFKGLFGIHGTLRVWIDATSRKPLLIQGTLPVSVLDLKARIELISTGDAEIIKLRRASTQKALMDQSAERPR